MEVTTILNGGPSVSDATECLPGFDCPDGAPLAQTSSSMITVLIPCLVGLAVGVAIGAVVCVTRPAWWCRSGAREEPPPPRARYRAEAV